LYVIDLVTYVTVQLDSNIRRNMKILDTSYFLYYCVKGVLFCPVYNREIFNKYPYKAILSLELGKLSRQ